MAYHKSWTNSDLIEDMIARKYPGYTELHTFLTVMHGGEFYAVSLIQKGESRMAIFSQRRCDGYRFFYETKETIEFADKAEGNEFFKKVNATKKASKKRILLLQILKTTRHGGHDGTAPQGVDGHTAEKGVHHDTYTGSRPALQPFPRRLF